MQGMALAGYGIEMIILAYALAGVPVIVVGFHGVRYRNESFVRMYLYYLWITIVAAVCLIVKEFVLEGPCHQLASITTSAWMCGVARYINIVIIVMSLSILVYFQHVVYSHCEDIAEVGGGPELADLMHNKDHYRKS